jgi:hypothetical protein
VPCDECAPTKVAYTEERAARLWAEEVLTARVARRDARIAALEAELARYRTLFQPPAITSEGGGTSAPTPPSFRGPQISSPPS